MNTPRAVSRGKRILLALMVTVGVWLGWQRWIRPDHVRNPVRSACKRIEFEGDRFSVCRVDPAHHTIELALLGQDKRPLRGFSALAQHLGAQAQNIVFAINAGMYDRAGMPIGLYVEHNKTIKPVNQRTGPGNFHMMPNGVFWRDPAGLHVGSTATFTALKPSADFATQSGPMLVVDGRFNPHFTADGQSRHVRNGVGVTADQRAVFVISESEVSFGKFARLFRDGLGCPNALYLDGLVSSLWDAGSGRIDQKFPLGPIVVVSQ